MIDYMLRFESEEAAQAVLFDQVPVKWEADKEGNSVPVEFEPRQKHKDTDIIGVIFKPTGNTLTDDEGVEYPEMAPLEGFHANVRAEAPVEALEAYRVYPENPVRVWA